jgi:hypothetical protein
MLLAAAGVGTAAGASSYESTVSAMSRNQSSLSSDIAEALAELRGKPA